MHTQLHVLFITLTVLFAVRAQAQATRPIPTNSLAFHLRNLGRVPTAEEQGIIEASLALMHRYQIRSDYPLRSIRRDSTRKEWVLSFSKLAPDAGFELFLTNKLATRVEVHWAGTRERMTFPTETKRKGSLQAPPPKESAEPLPRTLRPDLPRLSPAESATPAKLKDDDYRKVSGDYAYADLEAVMLLIGRVDGRRGSVTRVQFFHGVAASVMVGELSPVEYLCTQSADRVWSIVGTKHTYY